MNQWRNRIVIWGLTYEQQEAFFLRIPLMKDRYDLHLMVIMVPQDMINGKVIWKNLRQRAKRELIS